MKRLPKRRGRGFESISALSPQSLGLSKARSLQLLVESGWAEVVGEALSRRVRPLGIKRGVLELEVVDERWVEPLLEMIPRLAGRLAARHPQLGVRRLKIRCADRDFSRDPVLEREPDAGPEESSSRADSEPAPSIDSIETIRDRYLERQRSR